MPAFVAIVLSPGLPAAAHESERQSLPQDESVDGTDAEHHQRMTVQPIQQPAPPGQRQVLPHRQHVDVADAAPIEIAGARVVNGMRAPPKIIGRQGHHADHTAHPVVDERACGKTRRGRNRAGS